MKDNLARVSEIISKVQNLMKKLKYKILATRLRCSTHRNVEIANETRWSSTYNIISRYTELERYTEQLKLGEATVLFSLKEEDVLVVSLLR